MLEGIGSDDDDAKICELLTVEDLSECFAEVSLVSVPRSDTHPPAGLCLGAFSAVIPPLLDGGDWFGVRRVEEVREGLVCVPYKYRVGFDNATARERLAPATYIASDVRRLIIKVRLREGLPLETSPPPMLKAWGQR